MIDHGPAPVRRHRSYRRRLLRMLTIVLIILSPLAAWLAVRGIGQWRMMRRIERLERLGAKVATETDETDLLNHLLGRPFLRHLSELKAIGVPISDEEAECFRSALTQAVAKGVKP